MRGYFSKSLFALLSWLIDHSLPRSFFFAYNFPMQQGTPSTLNGNGRCHLTYFAGRGLAQPLRYMLAACGISWDETHLKEPSQIAALRAAGRLQFGQVPLLELHGKDHVQSGACLRYVDRACGSGAKRTAAEQYDVDVWADGAVDFYRVFTPLPFSGDASARAAYIENKIHAQAVPRYIPTFEAQLARTGGWLAGTPTPSHADAALYAAVEFAIEVESTSPHKRCLNFLAGSHHSKHYLGWLHTLALNTTGDTPTSITFHRSSRR